MTTLRWATFIALLGLPGCTGRGDGTIHVRGTVTFNGAPVLLGMIVLEPDPALGGEGPQGYAEIRDGQFDTRSSGKGVRPGAVILHLNGGDGVNANRSKPFGNVLFVESLHRLVISPDQPEIAVDVPATARRSEAR